MPDIKRTDSNHSDFKILVRQLDTYLAKIDGEEHDFYHQFNKIDALKYAVVLYENEVAVGCGAFKELDSTSVEIKRMFIHPYFRAKGYATTILEELESWAKELNYNYSKLETGKRMPDAVAFYKKCGYKQISNYGQYIDIDNSVCFEKSL